MTVSSNTAKLMIAEGAGAADTSVGTLTVALAAPGRDHRLRPGTMPRSPRPFPIDGAAPVLMSLVSLQSGGTAGNGRWRPATSYVLTFSEPSRD